jgi:hypothetical protein
MDLEWPTRHILARAAKRVNAAMKTRRGIVSYNMLMRRLIGFCAFTKLSNVSA